MNTYLSVERISVAFPNIRPHPAFASSLSNLASGLWILTPPKDTSMIQQRDQDPDDGIVNIEGEELSIACNPDLLNEGAEWYPRTHHSEPDTTGSIADSETTTVRCESSDDEEPGDPTTVGQSTQIARSHKRKLSNSESMSRNQFFSG